MATPAYERGAARARYLHRLFRRNIIGAAVNPYKRASSRADWQKGFSDNY